MTLGLRPLDLDQWLEVDERYDEQMAEKATLLSERHDEVVATASAGDGAAGEVADLVTAWMGEHHAGLAAHLADGRADGPADGPAQRRSEVHPIEVAARVVQEDLCVLVHDGSAWRLEAACVCFPSRWRLADKIGATVAQIHGPVPDYAGTTSRVVDASLDRLRVERPQWRLNWTILDEETLFQPTAARPAHPSPLRDLGALSLRVERQTLRRLPDTGAILFTIRTYVSNLGDVVSTPGTAADLAATLRTCSPELAAYKGWTDLLPRVVAMLDRTAAQAGV